VCVNLGLRAQFRYYYLIIYAMNCTIYMSKENLNYYILETTILTHNKMWDVDCSIYKNRSFTNGRFEDGVKIEFFNIDDLTMSCLYKAWREYLKINCIVIDMPKFFGCIIKSPLLKGSDLKCSND